VKLGCGIDLVLKLIRTDSVISALYIGKKLNEWKSWKLFKILIWKMY